MADQLFVCYWLRGYSPANMLRHWEKMLRQFPFLPRNPANPILQVRAISYQEPPLLERPFDDPLDLDEVLACAREYSGADIACQLDAWWGLWLYEREWTLKPARVSLSCFGPQFDAPEGEHLRVDFGLDAYFLPWEESPGSMKFTESNINGLLKLVHSLDDALAVERRQLLTESGENFAEKLRLLSMDL